MVTQPRVPPIVGQFAKFATVGLGSTAIDVGLHFVLMFGLSVGGEPLGAVFGAWLVATFPAAFAYADPASEAAVPVFKVVSAGTAMLNSFVWNRRWTFRILGPEQRVAQLRRFLLVSVTGMVLNTLVVTVLTSILPLDPHRSLGVASAVATVAVALWNFGGQRLWAFSSR